MSDGPIGEGLTFWATINIKGALTKEELKSVTNGIRELMKGKGINGDIVHSVRLTAAETPVLSISMPESKTHAGKQRS